MKIIKIIFTAFVLFLTNIAQAQTKEETEQWLNEYGKQITLSYKFIYDTDIVQNSTFKFTGFDGEFLNFYISKKYSDGGSYQDTYKVLPKDVFYQDISAFSEKDFENNEQKQTKRHHLKAKSGTVFHSGKATNGKMDNYTINYNFYEGDKSEINENISSIYIDFSKDQSKDAVSILKAIYHLAKLNGASDLPKVKKDTF